jgi:hypothetical protein
VGTGPAWRHARWWLIVAAVVALHGLVMGWLSEQLLALDARQASSRMARMQAAYVRELRPTAPPAAPKPPAPHRAPRPRAAAPVPAEAASRPAPEAREPAQAAAEAASAASASAWATAASAAASASAQTPPVQPPGEPASTASQAGEPPQLAEAAASAPPEAAASALASTPPASAADTGASGAAATTAAASTASAPAAATSDAVAPGPSDDAAADSFAWPLSTRIRYVLTGQYRGEVHGSAEVQWLRDGDRYQVHLDAVIGPSFAPLGSRRMSSAGRTTALGLQPEQYEQQTRMLLGEPRRLRMAFDGDAITLANGTRVLRTPAMQDVQDTASQFVQLVWLFRTQPALLEVGRSVEFMLALPRRVHRWTYDVVGREPIATPAGPVEAFHVKPRRDALPGDLTTEMWFAPSLQYLPVRLLIRQDAQTYVDLAMQGLPEQAQR